MIKIDHQVIQQDDLQDLLYLFELLNDTFLLVYLVQVDRDNRSVVKQYE